MKKEINLLQFVAHMPQTLHYSLIGSIDDFSEDELRTAIDEIFENVKNSNQWQYQNKISLIFLTSLWKEKHTKFENFSKETSNSFLNLLKAINGITAAPNYGVEQTKETLYKALAFFMPYVYVNEDDFIENYDCYKRFERAFKQRNPELKKSDVLKLRKKIEENIGEKEVKYTTHYYKSLNSVPVATLLEHPEIIDWNYIIKKNNMAPKFNKVQETAFKNYFLNSQYGREKLLVCYYAINTYPEILEKDMNEKITTYNNAPLRDVILLNEENFKKLKERAYNFETKYHDFRLTWSELPTYLNNFPKILKILSADYEHGIENCYNRFKKIPKEEIYKVFLDLYFNNKTLDCCRAVIHSDLKSLIKISSIKTLEELQEFFGPILGKKFDFFYYGGEVIYTLIRTLFSKIEVADELAEKLEALYEKYYGKAFSY